MATIWVLPRVHELAVDVITQLVVRDWQETWWNSSTAMSRSSKASDTKAIQGETERGVGADKCLVPALQETFDGGRPYHRCPPSSPGASQRFHLRLDASNLPRSRNWLSGSSWKLAPMDLLWHHDDGLFELLVGQFVQRDEHERTALARSRRRLDEKILLAALLVGALLHRAHAKRVSLRGAAGASVGDRNGGDGFPFLGHAFAPAFRFLAAPVPAVILV